jgi:hypothetical protein
MAGEKSAQLAAGNASACTWSTNTAGAPVQSCWKVHEQAIYIDYLKPAGMMMTDALYPVAEASRAVKRGMGNAVSAAGKGVVARSEAAWEWAKKNGNSAAEWWSNVKLWSDDEKLFFKNLDENKVLGQFSIGPATAGLAIDKVKNSVEQDLKDLDE